MFKAVGSLSKEMGGSTKNVLSRQAHHSLTPREIPFGQRMSEISHKIWLQVYFDAHHSATLKGGKDLANPQSQSRLDYKNCWNSLGFSSCHDLSSICCWWGSRCWSCFRCWLGQQVRCGLLLLLPWLQARQEADGHVAAVRRKLHSIRNEVANDLLHSTRNLSMINSTSSRGMVEDEWDRVVLGWGEDDGGLIGNDRRKRRFLYCTTFWKRNPKNIPKLS